MIKLGLIPIESVISFFYLKFIYRIMHAESENSTASTIIVHIDFLYPIQWSMLHEAHIYTPSKILHPIYPPQHPTGLDITPYTINVQI